ncbi:MAG TPA: ATP-binding protein, partial [Acidimicrobiia bacterium]
QFRLLRFENRVPMKRFVEEVFVTEGVPEFSFVPPPNFGDILVDIRKPGKPVILEGQSGTGKTTAAKKIIETIGIEGVEYLTTRGAVGVSRIDAILRDRPVGTFVIDDLHRLAKDAQAALAGPGRARGRHLFFGAAITGSVGRPPVRPGHLMLGAVYVGSTSNSLDKFTL